MKKVSEFKWKRQSATTGKWSWLDQNNLRGYDCKIVHLKGYKINDEYCGFLSNVSKGRTSLDNSNQWQVFFIASGGSVAFKRKFDFYDVENAKKFFEILFCEVMLTDKYQDIRQRILDLGKLEKIS